MITKPTSLAEDYLYRYRGSTIVAACAFALGLMRDDPETCKAGYSLANAAICVATHFCDPMLRHEIECRLRVEGDDSYKP